MGNVRVRIAPSPTGFLHLGTAHTALFNYVFAKHHGGKFILRIDDTDKERSKKEFEDDIVKSLKWLGLVWDEGPDIGGPSKIYRQSQRGEIYKKYLDLLIKEKKAYYCYCTPEELENERKDREAKKLPPIYSGKCRNISSKQGLKGAVRLINPNKKVTFIDLIRGKITVDSSLFGDFIIARSDGSILLNFAATIDDIEMKITHALRGEDFINMVPRQLLIFEALNEKSPFMGHLSFLYAPDKTKLSKRHGATSVSEFKALGYLSEAVVNYLGILGYSMADEREFFSLPELIRDFDITRVQKGAPIFNIAKLDWYNGHYIRKTKIASLVTQIYEFYNKKYSLDLIRKTTPIIQERIKKLSDYIPLCGFFFERPRVYEKDLTDQKRILADTVNVLKTLSKWGADSIGQAMQSVQKKSGLKSSDYFMTIRIAVTGKKISPPLNESMEILGKKEVLERLKMVSI